MPLFKSKKERDTSHPTLFGLVSHGSYLANEVPEHQPPPGHSESAGTHNGRGQQQQHKKQKSSSAQSSKQFKHGAHVSKTSFNIGGLSINVFGYQELPPVFSRASAPTPPEVCVVIHMHGRTGSANNEENIIRHLYDEIDRCKKQAAHTQQRQKDVICVSFDARNHGHRKTSDLGQKGWKEGNKLHALDLYAMYRE